MHSTGLCGDEGTRKIKMKENFVVLITGGNAGVGLTVADRALTTHSDKNVRLILACRNRQRAEDARKKLLQSHNGADISIVMMDTSCVNSVVDAVKVVKEKFSRIDVMYLNAGIMPVKPGINWDNFINGIRDGKLVHMFTTGEGLLSQYDETTAEGFRKIFATNLFGHYVLIREVEDILGGNKPTQIIWTSSRASKQKAFSIRDIQHREGADPYGSSKYAMDMLSVALNDKYNSRGIYSHTTCPGLVMTNLTNAIFPWWIWYILLPMFWLLRAFVVSLNCSSHNGSEALIWVTKQKPESLDPHSRYNSNTNILGRCYITAEKLSFSPVLADQLYEECEKIYKDFKH